MSNKTRLDVLLVEQGLLESRQKAQAVIMAGSVFVDGQRVDKPGTAVPNTAAIQVRGHALPYVSRGGLKLEKAMQTFPLTMDGKVCADIGASTGGFTDCMLQTGPQRSTLWMWATANWTGSSGETRGWCAWNAPTPAILPMSRSQRSWTLRRWTCRLSPCG